MDYVTGGSHHEPPLSFSDADLFTKLGKKYQYSSEFADDLMGYRFGR